LTEIAESLARAEMLHRASAIASLAEAAARSVTDPYRQAELLAEVAQSLVRTGQLYQAILVADSIANPVQRAQALTQILSSPAAPETLTQMADWLARAGKPEQATKVAQLAETAAQSITDLHRRADILAQIASS